YWSQLYTQIGHMILRTPQRWTRVVVLVHAEIVPAHPCARYWCVSVDTLSLAPYTVLPRAARSVKARSTWCRFVRDPGVQAAGRGADFGKTPDHRGRASSEK